MNFERLCIMICWIFNYIHSNCCENFKKSDSSAMATPEKWDEIQETKNKFDVARCGFVEKLQTKRMRRYATHNRKWGTNKLTYKITNYPRGWNTSRHLHLFGETIAAAFDIWTEVTQLQISRRLTGYANIVITFGPLDGPGNAFGTAQGPNEAGSVVILDESEKWSLNSFQGVDLLSSALHQIGHALGLEHSQDPAAIMFHTVGYKPGRKLSQDDINGIQSLYGRSMKPINPNKIRFSCLTCLQSKPNAQAAVRRPISTTVFPVTRKHTQSNFRIKVTPPHVTIKNTQNSITSAKLVGSTPTALGNNKELCESHMFDTIFTTPDGSTYIFKDDKCWKIMRNSIAAGFPRKISSTWVGLPNHIDAAISIAQKTYFFKGSQVWRYTGFQLDNGFPQSISDLFPGAPHNMLTALTWHDGAIYFFKGNKYYHYHKEKYPRAVLKSMTDWQGIPGAIDAAFKWTDGQYYFFKDGFFWQFDAQKMQVTNSNPSYPLKTGQYWFGCPATPTGSKES